MSLAGSGRAMISDLDGILGFITTVESGNFSAAAKELGVTPSAVSKQIARLEARLGVPLFTRNSRGLSLTEAGQAYYHECTKGVAQLSLAEEQIGEFRSRPSGVLNVRAPQAFGIIHVAPHIPKFLALHPDITVDLTLRYNEDVELSSRQDIIISSTDPQAESMIVRPLVPIERVACAAPTYLEKHGRPTTTSELGQHNCLVFTGSSSQSGHWTLRTKQGVVRVPVSGNFKTNNHDVLYMAVMQGMGIAHMPSYVVSKALRQGALVALFGDRKDRRIRTTRDTMNVYYAQEKDRFPKIRVFVDFLLCLFQNKASNL
jgi:DNA-binding transcriptional LysR family regulator